MGVELHDAYGWWLKDAWRKDGRPEPAPALTGDRNFTHIVVGGGFTGMWAALGLLGRVEPESICLLESGMCGSGPSGRNGGFADTLVHSMPRVTESNGPEAARLLLAASEESVSAIGRWAAQAGEEIWFRAGGQLIVNCGLGQDGEWLDSVRACRAIGRSDALVELSQPEVARCCSSPVFGNGALAPLTSTLHPGLLAMALRRHLIASGVEVFENSAAIKFGSRENRVSAETAGGSVVAESGILAAGSQSAGFRGLRREVTLTSSHIVITEPVPELVDQLGWNGGEAITDARHLVHYFRTTDDGRIVFGWGGGRIASGSRGSVKESVDRGVLRKVESDLLRFFPELKEAKLDHGWGGPIDASPSHLPSLRPFAPGWFAAFGYTGNGVGPSHLCGAALADLALGQFHPGHPAAPLLKTHPLHVPPEPFRKAGGMAIRRAIESCERNGEFGRQPGRVAELIAGIPDRIGYRIGR